MHYPRSSVFITGTMQIGKTGAISTMYRTFSSSLIIDTHSDTIINFNCSMVITKAIEFACQLLVGRNIVTDVDEMIETIQKRFLVLSQKALIVALRDAQNRYQMSVREF